MDLARVRELGLLDDSSRSIEGPPDPDLLSPLELTAAHDAAVFAEELPRAVHLLVELEAAVSDPAGREVVDNWDSA